MVKIAAQNYSEVQREKNKKLKLRGFPFEIEETYPDYIDTDKILNAEIELYEIFEPYEIEK